MSYGLAIYENGKNTATYFDKYVIDCLRIKGKGSKSYNIPSGMKLNIISLAGLHSPSKVKVVGNVLSWNLDNGFYHYCVIMESL
nr:hypothetical protein [Providencia rettgeri]